MKEVIVDSAGQYLIIDVDLSPIDDKQLLVLAIGDEEVVLSRDQVGMLMNSFYRWHEATRFE